MRHVLRPLPLTLSLLLAACATAPIPQPAPPKAEAPVAVVPDVADGVPASPQAPAATNVWERLRGSFAMADCAADPAIDVWARRYTRSPRHFEA